MGEKYVQEEFLGEESLGEESLVKSMCEKSFWVKSLWVKSICVKSIWGKSLWVKNHWGKVGLDGMLAFVPPFSGLPPSAYRAGSFVLPFVLLFFFLVFCIFCFSQEEFFP